MKPVIRLVLVEPQLPANIGACARVAANFGIEDVRLVAPQCEWRSFEASKLATGYAEKVFESIREHSTLAEALEGCTAAVGFTRRFGEGRRARQSYTELEVLKKPQETLALLFGNERVGLTAEQLEACTHLATIPVSDALPSLNLSHAVAVVCGRLFEMHHGTTASPPRRIKSGLDLPSTLDEREGLYSHWRECLVAAGLTRAGNPERMLLRIRRILGSRELTRRDVQLLRGYLSKSLLAMKRT